VTGFTNAEEEAVKLVDEVPFLLESMLTEQGATFIGISNFQPHVIVDGNLITGQNPASSAGTAKALLKQAQTK
jgi:putative intracellular protease/amidase